ncbi:MAG: hypothetical protein ACOY3V_04785 [Pseudomonadota bacterium]
MSPQNNSLANPPIFTHTMMLRPALNRACIVLLLLTLSACTTQRHSSVVNAATTPLNDLNLLRAEIPEVLARAQKNPYAIPEDLSCDAFVGSLLALDEALGPDLDTPASDDDPGLIERGSNMAGNAAIGAVRRTTESIIPFRSWIRKLTGAERHSREVAASIAAGIVRRAFLKGLRVSKGCS